MSELNPRWRRPENAEDLARRQLAFKIDLAARLASPLDRATPAALIACLESDRIDLVAALPSGLEDYPDLPIRLRGALGRALAQLPSPVQGRFDPFGRPPAFELLYQSLGRLNGRDEIPKPMVLHCDVRGRELHIRLRLIGLAGYWWPDVAEALQLMCDTGISPHNDSRHRLTIHVLKLTHHRNVGLEQSAVQYPTSMHVRLVSPLRLRSLAASHFSARAFLIAAANRVARMVCWHGARLDVDWDAIHHSAGRIRIEQQDLVAMQWDRGSQRAHGRIPVLGLLGTCRFTGDLTLFEPILRLSEMLNLGSHASLGFGRIAITCYP